MRELLSRVTVISPGPVVVTFWISLKGRASRISWHTGVSCERSVQDGCEAFGSSEWRWSLHVTENQALCILLHVYKAVSPPLCF